MLVVPAAVEESRAARQQRQQARLRDRGGIFVPPENNAILDFLLARTVTGESPSKANTRRESLRPRTGSSPVREDGKGKGRAVESPDEEVVDAAIHISNPTRRKSGRVAGPGHGQPAAGPSRDVAEEDGARLEPARAKGEDNTKHAPAAPKPKPRSRATRGKTKVKEAPQNVSKSDEDDDEPAQEATQSQPKLKSKPKPRARAAKAKKLPPADESAEDEPAIEKPKSKPRATKFKGKKPPEPAIADDSEPEPDKSLNLQYHTLAYSYMTEKSETVKGKVQPTKSRKTPKADVADGSEPGLADDHVADEAEFAKPVAKKRGRPPKIKASAADDAAHTQDEVVVTPSEVDPPKLATRRSPTKRARDADSDDEDLSNYLPAARKRAKTAAIPEAKAKPAPKRAKTRTTVVAPNSPKLAPTRKAPVRKKKPQPGPLVDPYDSDGSAVVIAVKKKPGKARAAVPSRQDLPPEPAPKVPECPKMVTKKPPPPKPHEEDALAQGSDGDSVLGAKVSKLKVPQKTAKSNRARAKVALDESEDEGDEEAVGAKASKPKNSKPVKKSVRATPPAELVEEAHAEGAATTSRPKAPAIVAKASRPRIKLALAEAEEASGEMASAQQRSTSKPQPKPRKRATKASIRESEEQEEPQQAPAKISTKKGSTKGNVKRAREKDEAVATVDPGPTRKKAKTTATSDFQSDETLVAQAPPLSSKLDRRIDSTRSPQVKTQTAKGSQKPAAKLDTHKTKRLPPEIKKHINSKPSARLPPPESDDDPIDFLS